MDRTSFGQTKIGILGGGQLGKMLGQAASKWNWNLHILESKSDCPAAATCSDITIGNFKNYDDVYQFGLDKDIVTVEIENVNTAALKALQKEGVVVHPDPAILEIIKDKGLQKEFYASNKLPTSSFTLYDGKKAIMDAISNGSLSLPFVQKARTEGYDGKGVAVITNEADLEELLDASSIIEPLVPIEKEIAVIVAKNTKNEIAVYDPVEMVFNPVANLVDYLIAPARINDDHQTKAKEIAIKIVNSFDNYSGLLAVEFFLTKQGTILINEVAPRPHNSGHHSIEACVTSQYSQHLRAISGLPLGATSLYAAAVMCNILGSPNSTGTTKIEGMDKVLEAGKDVHYHFYGKATTKPFRKMGHFTVVNPDLEAALKTATFVKNNLKIIADE